MDNKQKVPKIHVEVSMTQFLYLMQESYQQGTMDTSDIYKDINQNKDMFIHMLLDIKPK